MRRAAVALLLLLGLVASPASAVEKWDTWLRPSATADVIAGRDTVLLATSDAGLWRYLRLEDRWESVTREPSGLAGNNLSVMTRDRSGNLYVSVPGKGLARLSTSGRWSLINAFDGLPSDSVLALRAQRDSVWIGTTRGLALWNGRVVAGSIPDLGTTSPFSSNAITGIAINGDTLYVGTTEGSYMARLSQRLANWSALNSYALLAPSPVIRSMACTANQVFVIAFGRNAATPSQQILTTFRLDRGTGVWVVDVPQLAGGGSEFQTRRVRDDLDRVTCTTLSGVYRWNAANNWTFIAGSPVTNNLDDIAVEPSLDPDGRLFATTSAGVLLEQASPAFLARRPPGPVGNNARNILWAGGSVYVSMDNSDPRFAGISRLRDGVWRNWAGADPECSGDGCDTTFTTPMFATAMLADPLGGRWIGMWDGPLTRFDDTVVPPRFNNSSYASSAPDTVHLHSCVHAAVADSNSGANAGHWFGLDSDRIGDANGNPLGLDVYDTSGVFVRNYGPGYPGLRNGLVRALVTDRLNRIWVGYKGNGLSTFPVPETIGSAITLTDVPPPPDGTNLDVFGLAAYGDSIWVLAADGLHRYRRTTTAYAGKLAIAAPPALFSVHPLAVGPDGAVYVATIGGVRVHKRGQLPVDWTSENSPLGNNEVRSVYCEPSGVVWVATAGGIHRVDPDFVPPPAPTLSTLRVRLYPNPAWLTGAGVNLRIGGDATLYTGEVMDLSGRVVHRFTSTTAGNVFWDGRDLEGARVRPGVYFVRARGDGAEGVSRVVLLR